MGRDIGPGDIFAFAEIVIGVTLGSVILSAIFNHDDERRSKDEQGGNDGEYAKAIEAEEGYTMKREHLDKSSAQR